MKSILKLFFSTNAENSDILEELLSERAFQAMALITILGESGDSKCEQELRVRIDRSRFKLSDE